MIDTPLSLITRRIFYSCAAGFSVVLVFPITATAQSLQIANMAVPAKSFQMVIYPVAQQKGYMLSLVSADARFCGAYPIKVL